MSREALIAAIVRILKEGTDQDLEDIYKIVLHYIIK